MDIPAVILFIQNVDIFRRFCVSRLDQKIEQNEKEGTAGSSVLKLLLNSEGYVHLGFNACRLFLG